MTTRRRPNEGFILVSVVAIAALLAALVGAMSLIARQAVETARLARDELVAEALAEAGVQLAGYQLFALRRPLAAVNGQEVRFDAGIVRLFVSSDAKLVDINAAEPDALAQAWKAAKLTSMSPEEFADRVVDWRDADSEPLPHGAEADSYDESGSGHRPHNAPFRLVSELAFVLGIKRTDVSILRRFVTVTNPSSGAASGEDPASDEAESVPDEEPPPPSDLDPGDSEEASETPPNILRVIVRVERPGHPVVDWHAILLQLSPAGSRPFQTVSWHRLSGVATPRRSLRSDR